MVQLCIRLGAVSLFSGRLGRSCCPQTGRKKRKLRQESLGALASFGYTNSGNRNCCCVGGESSYLGVRGLSESCTDGRLGMHRGCVSSGNLQFSSSALFFSLYEKERQLALACLKHRIVRWWGKCMGKNQKARIWFGSYPLSVLSYYRSLISRTCAKAVFAGDFMQPRRLILKPVLTQDGASDSCDSDEARGLDRPTSPNRSQIFL